MDIPHLRPVPDPEPARQTFVARNPVDLIAMVPMALGFHPEDSVVMLTFGGRRGSFHARVDLPLDLAIQDEVAQNLTAAAVRNRTSKCALLLYTDDVAAAESQGFRVADALLAEGVAVIDVLRVAEERWFPLPDDGSPGTPFDLRAHPFTAQRVFEGQVVHEDRDALADSLVGTDHAEVAKIEEAASRFADGLWRQVGTSADAVRRAEAILSEARWIHRLVDEQLRTGAPVGVEAAARLLVVLTIGDLRDVAWSQLGRKNARQHVELWKDLVRRAPTNLLPAPAALLALAAWQAGDGALAWCAVDRCVSVDPDHSLAQLVGDLLTAAVPPEEWPRMVARVRPLVAGSGVVAREKSTS